MPLKIDNSKSRFNKQNETKISKEDFENTVNQALDSSKSLQEQLLPLSLAFIKRLEDKKLSKNKTEIDKNLDKELIGKLLTLAQGLNVDQTQPDGSGSNTLALLSIKGILKLLDRINELDFQIQEIKKVTSQLE